MRRALFSLVLSLSILSTALGAPVTSPSNGTDPQSSLTLDPSQIQSGLEQNGVQAASNETGQVPSLTSSNNFINFCLTQTDVPLTNGTQILNGSCNPTPMGRIVSKNVMPATKFLFPANLDTGLVENQTFTVKLIVTNLQTGHFTNPHTNYLAAPAQVNDKGHLIGHAHIVIQKIPALNSTEVPDPREFVFFQGVNAPAKDGILSANVTGGLPAGYYRMGSMTAAANHQPALVAVAQRGMIDDTVYFTVQPASNGTGSQPQPQSQAPAKRHVVGAASFAIHRSGFRFPKAMALCMSSLFVNPI